MRIGVLQTTTISQRVFAPQSAVGLKRVRGNTRQHGGRSIRGFKEKETNNITIYLYIYIIYGTFIYNMQYIQTARTRREGKKSHIIIITVYNIIDINNVLLWCCSTSRRLRGPR